MFAPDSTSSAASRSAFGVVFVYWKAAGVGDERDVQRLRDVRRQRHVELAEDVAQHLRRRRRVGDDQIRVAEARVVVVVVDVDREARGVEDLRIGPEPAFVCAVDGEQDALGRVVRDASAQVVERHERVLAGQRRVAGEVRDGVLAELPQRERRGEQRSEGVAVRILVRRDEEAVVGPQRLDDRGEVSLLLCGRLRRAHRSVRTSVRPPPPSDRIGTSAAVFA